MDDEKIKDAVALSDDQMETVTGGLTDEAKETLMGFLYLCPICKQRAGMKIIYGANKLTGVVGDQYICEKCGFDMGAAAVGTQYNNKTAIKR